MDYKGVIKQLEERKMKLTHYLNSDKISDDDNKQSEISGALNEIELCMDSLNQAFEIEYESESDEEHLLKSVPQKKGLFASVFSVF